MQDLMSGFQDFHFFSGLQAVEEFFPRGLRYDGIVPAIDKIYWDIVPIDLSGNLVEVGLEFPKGGPHAVDLFSDLFIFQVAVYEFHHSFVQEPE